VGCGNRIEGKMSVGKEERSRGWTEVTRRRRILEKASRVGGHICLPLTVFLFRQYFTHSVSAAQRNHRALLVAAHTVPGSTFSIKCC